MLPLPCPLAASIVRPRNDVPPICCSALPPPTATATCLLPLPLRPGCLLPLPLPLPSLPQVVGSVAHTLETVIRSVQSSPGEAHDAIRHLLQLKAVGVPAAQRMDPVG